MRLFLRFQPIPDPCRGMPRWCPKPRLTGADAGQEQPPDGVDALLHHPHFLNDSEIAFSTAGFENH